MNNINVIKKQLKTSGDMGNFPSSIILFVGASGTGKTLAAEMTLNLIQNEMTLYLINYSVASFTGTLPKLTDIIQKNAASERTIAALEHAVKYCNILYMEDFDQVVTSRTGKISIDKYIMINYILRYFNVGKSNAEKEIFHGVTVATTSYPKKIDQAALRRIGTIIKLDCENKKQEKKLKKIFIMEELTAAYEDKILSELLDRQYHEYYIAVLLHISKNISPSRIKTFVQDVLTRCVVYGENILKLKAKIKSGIAVHQNQAVNKVIEDKQFIIDINNFQKIAKQVI